MPTRDKEVKITDYDIKNGIELNVSETDYLPLPIDKDYACNELIDGYEASAVPDNIRAQRLESAGYSIGVKKEEMAIDELKKGTISTDTEALTETNVYKKIAFEVKNMKKRGMKPANMRIALSSETELLLLTDEKFSNTSSTIGAELVREGVIGKVAGVATKPNYFLDEAGIDFVIYDKRYCQKYEIWKKEPSINDLSDGKHIGASALQGRQVGGLMVTNPLGVQLRVNENFTTPVTEAKTLSIDSYQVIQDEVNSVKSELENKNQELDLTKSELEKREQEIAEQREEMERLQAEIENQSTQQTSSANSTE